MSGVQVRTQDHLRQKVRKKLNPLIEDEKLMLKSLVSDMAQKGYVALSKKIGADKVIDQLAKAELEHDNAVRSATSFFKKHSRSNVAYRDSLNYEFRNGESKKITSEKCREQMREWSEKFAEREVAKTEQGKKLNKLETLEEACDDLIMEASTQGELTKQLNEMLGYVGIQWNSFKSLGYKK
tara:strand:+ start:1072 stop:1617 length:546 start_codon:yes stop_codon:yes gene_type:complete